MTRLKTKSRSHSQTPYWWRAFENSPPSVSENTVSVFRSCALGFVWDLYFVFCDFSAGQNYANPHAATQVVAGIATSTYFYDNNGNITSATGTASTTYGWDYRNRMTQSAASTTATTTNIYDHSDQRARKGTGTATTTYVSKFFDTTSSTATTSATTTLYVWDDYRDKKIALLDRTFKKRQRYYNKTNKVK